MLLKVSCIANYALGVSTCEHCQERQPKDRMSYGSSDARNVIVICIESGEELGRVAEDISANEKVSGVLVLLFEERVELGRWL